MLKATDDVVELDLLGLHPRPVAAAAAADQPSTFRRSSSIREIQCAIARMDPAVVKSVIASGSPVSSAAAAARYGTRVEAGDDTAASPLTIFYNGTVSVFELTHEKAKNILRMAADASSGGIPEASDDIECLNGVVSQNGRCWLLRRATHREEEVTAAIPPEAQRKVMMIRRDKARFLRN